MRRTKEDASITKARIIEKAIELFIQKGFSNTTLDEIAQQANVTRGAIYWHFEDKIDIVKELIANEHEILTKLLTSIFSEDKTPFIKIQNVIEEVIKHFFNSKSFQNFIELTWFKIEYTQLSKLKTTKVELTEYFIANLEIVLKEGQKIGEIRSETNINEVAITITSMINGMYRLYFILPRQMKNIKQTMNMFTNYLKLLR